MHKKEEELMEWVSDLIDHYIATHSKEDVNLLKEKINSIIRRVEQERGKH